MAVFNLGSGTDLNNLDDIQKVKSYLYKLTEQLQYMFNNLTPEDNYSENAQLVYVANQDRQAKLELSLDAISASYMTQDGVEAAIKLSEDQAAMTYSTKDGVKSAIELSEQQAALIYVAKSGVISAINLTEETAKITASKIMLEGIVTANNYFKILLDGSMEATNGKFTGTISGSTINGSTINIGGSGTAGTLIVKNSSGTEIGRWSSNGISISAGTINGPNIVLGGNNNVSGTLTVKNASGVTVGTWTKDGISVSSGTISGATITGGTITGTAITGNTITGGTITGSHLYGSYIGSTSDDFYVVEDGNSVEVGAPGFWFGDDIMHSNWIGSVYNPATGDDTAGINGGSGDAGFRKLYLLDDWYEGTDGSFWDVTRTIRWLDSRLSAIESTGCGSNTCNCDEGGDGGTCNSQSACPGEDYFCRVGDDGPIYCDIESDCPLYGTGQCGPETAPCPSYDDGCDCNSGESCNCNTGEGCSCESGQCGPGYGM